MCRGTPIMILHLHCCLKRVGIKLALCGYIFNLDPVLLGTVVIDFKMTHLLPVIREYNVFSLREIVVVPA